MVEPSGSWRRGVWPAMSEGGIFGYLLNISGPSDPAAWEPPLL